MKTIKLTLPLLAITGFVLAGCPSDDEPGVETESTTGDTTTTGSPTTTPPVTESTTLDPDTTDTATVTVGETETTAGTTEDPVGPFVFDETPFEDYAQVDRKGFPAVNTGLNLLGDKDEYNAASPADDAALMFATNIFESLETLHLGAPGAQTPLNTGLDDDLMALSLSPCVTPPLPMDNCDDQGGPFAIPDVITIDLDDDPGFPNGRRLEDPVIDVIFAVLLLDLDDHPVTTFVDLDGDGTPGPSLNPVENDVAFPGAFPYLAAANE
jgi:hypothetical protein